MRDEYVPDGLPGESQGEVQRARQSEPAPGARAELTSGARAALPPGSRAEARGRAGARRSAGRFTRPALVAVAFALVVGGAVTYWVTSADSGSADGARVYAKCPVSSGLSTVEEAYGVALPKEADQVRYCGDKVGTLGGAVFEFTAATDAVDAYLTSIGINPTEMRATPFVYRFRTENWPLSTGQAYLTTTMPWRQFKPCSTTMRVILGEPVDERRTAYMQVACAN